MAESISKPDLMDSIGWDNQGKSSCYSRMHQWLFALLVKFSIFARPLLVNAPLPFSIVCLMTLKSSKRSFVTNLSTSLAVRLGRPCLDLCNFRIQNFLFCCQAGSCLLQYGHSFCWCGFSASLSFLYKIKRSAKFLSSRDNSGATLSRCLWWEKGGSP